MVCGLVELEEAAVGQVPHDAAEGGGGAGEIGKRHGGFRWASAISSSIAHLTRAIGVKPNIYCQISTSAFSSLIDLTSILSIELLSVRFC